MIRRRPRSALLPDTTLFRSEREGAGQEKAQKRRKKPLSEPSYMTRKEYELTKVALERSDVPAEALALLSAWIEGEHLMVDEDRKSTRLNSSHSQISYAVCCL